MTDSTTIAPSNTSTTQTQQATQTLTFEANPSPAPANDKLVALKTALQALIDMLLPKLNSLKLVDEAERKQKELEELQAALKEQLAPIYKLQLELRSVQLNGQEKNTSYFIDACVNEMNKISDTQNLVSLGKLGKDLTTIKQKLTDHPYPELLQNKENPDAYSVTHVTKEQLQAAGKAACEAMQIDYKENDNGFQASIPSNNLDEFHKTLMREIHGQTLTAKQENKPNSTQEAEMASSVTTKQ